MDRTGRVEPLPAPARSYLPAHGSFARRAPAGGDDPQPDRTGDLDLRPDPADAHAADAARERVHGAALDTGREAGCIPVAAIRSRDTRLATGGRQRAARAPGPRGGDSGLLVAGRPRARRDQGRRHLGARRRRSIHRSCGPWCSCLWCNRRFGVGARVLAGRTLAPLSGGIRVGPGLPSALPGTGPSPAGLGRGRLQSGLEPERPRDLLPCRYRRRRSDTA